MVPKIFVSKGQLFVERSNGSRLLPVDQVLFYGIFENDFDLLTGLSIWGGDCYPNPVALMNCRLKLPCLARAMQYTRFASKRGFISPDLEVKGDSGQVIKWGNWHCGENKTRLKGRWQHKEAAILEPFFEGQAVRLAMIGDQYWQIKLEGEDWLKYIHHHKADFMEVDTELLADTAQIRQKMGLDLIANDYIVGADGQKHLLEVNHIPNVTHFDALKNAYIQSIQDWLQSSDQ